MHFALIAAHCHLCDAYVTITQTWELIAHQMLWHCRGLTKMQMRYVFNGWGARKRIIEACREAIPCADNPQLWYAPHAAFFRSTHYDYGCAHF